MGNRDLRPAAEAVARIIMRFCGWEPIYETIKDGVTLVRALVGMPAAAPSLDDAERFTEWVQNNLTATFDSEYHQKLSSNDISAASLAVAELINSQNIDDIKIQAVKDSARLERTLLAKGGTRLRAELYSEEASSAFDLILRTSCRQIAEVTLSDKEFGPLALQRLLRSNDRLEAISNNLEQISSQILTGVSILTGNKYKDEDFAQYTSRYLARIAEQLDFFDLPGVDLERNRQRYSLSAAYIPLQTVDAGNDVLEYNSIASLMSAKPFLMIVGDPGSGKSTLLKWVAVQLARASAPSRDYRLQVPFIVKLRSLKQLPGIDNIGGPMSEGFAQPRPLHWSRDLLESGRGILLLDGLDEVPEQRRESVARWIDDLYSNEPARRGLRIIVTSRMPAIREDRFRPSKATMAYLQPMQQNHIEQFVRVWHRAIFDRGQHNLTDWQMASTAAAIG